MVTCQEVLDWCSTTLQVERFHDYAPNGLQVEGKPEITKILTSVTASKAAINEAVKQQADLLLVHHGMFWKSEPITITGWKKQRIATLLQHQVNMAGYHLPLDAHPDLGNNAQLAQLLGWQTDYCCGEQNLLHIGRAIMPQTLQLFGAKMEDKLKRKPQIIGDLNKKISKIGWCTGGAQGFFQTAVDEKVDVYVTGEISEAQYHLANETGVAFVSAGHHATERYGIQALGKALSQKFNLEMVFFDEENPA